MAITIEKSGDAVKKLGDLIKDIRIAMLTTVEADGVLHSRPMATQEVEFNGDLWFFTSAASGKAHEISSDQRVNLSYSGKDDNLYVSVSGTAQLVRDKDKIKELWQPMLRAWFPDGLDDPNLALLRISVEKAEYWDSPSSTVVKVVGFVKALATGKPANIGENKEIILDEAVTQRR